MELAGPDGEWVLCLKGWMPKHGGLSSLIEDIEATIIGKALALAENNRTKAAALLGIHRTTLVAKLKSYGIDNDYLYEYLEQLSELQDDLKQQASREEVLKLI